MKRIFLMLFLILGLGVAAYMGINKDNAASDSAKSANSEKSVISPLAKKSKNSVFGDENLKTKAQEDSVEKKYNSELEKGNIINVLLLGIDRRSKAELGFRTDIMILVSINKDTNKVIMTSIPRDLWYGGGRLNAVYSLSGWEELQNAFEEITGQRPQKYILTDFEDFAWIVDQMGGVDVNVQTTFTDSLYPVDETKEYQTISFTQGPETLTGERALIFARSRKGDNDNGDWGRMKRQHLILKGMLESITKPQSFFCKGPVNTNNTNSDCENSITTETLTSALKFVTTNKMDTNLGVTDLKYLWDFYKDREKYDISSMYMDYDYLYSPPQDEYGGAWVLIPIGKDYSTFKGNIKNRLLGLPEAPLENDVIEENVPENPVQ